MKQVLKATVEEAKALISKVRYNIIGVKYDIIYELCYQRQLFLVCSKNSRKSDSKTNH